MTYIDAFHDREKDIIELVGRDKEGRRFYNSYKPDHSFYFQDANGKYTSIYGENLSKVQCTSWKSYLKELKVFGSRKLYESDVKCVFKALEKHYLNAEIPKIQIAPFDIEVKFSHEKGYASPEDPHQAITAISLNYDWNGTMITLALKPDTITMDQGIEIAERFSNCYLFDSEEEMLKTFYDLIEDVDLLYGWNSEGFDIPYLVNRTLKILGKDYARRLCLWNMLPKKKTYEKYGKEQQTYEIFGRVHLDYMALYRKYTYGKELQSFRLDFIGEIEIGENKVPYEGTLDELYLNDFEKFIAYNRQDVALLTKLENKLKFINLINMVSHENCVLFNTALGTVEMTDQALALKCHTKDLIVPSKTHKDDKKIAGGYVVESNRGIHEWIATTDINSLYPSTIRTLNMSIETIVGQVRHHLTDQVLKNKQDASQQTEFGFIESDDDDEDSGDDKWEGLFACLEYTEIMNETDTILTVDFHEGETVQMTAKELYELVFNPDSNLCISANGTIFRTDVQGIIPELLSEWYAKRKEHQKKEAEYEKLAAECTDEEKKKEYEYLKNYWYGRQQAVKILLNALYGAITNPGSRFCDQRIGQSTTLSGRTIAKHMNSKISEILLGEYNHETQVNLGGDTDSSFFSIETIKDQLESQGFKVTKENFTELANNIANEINDSFPEFVKKAFHVTDQNSTMIKCGREICAERALFVKKKNYALLVYDEKNIRQDNGETPDGKLKIKGLATQRSDTSKSIQDFLKEVLLKVLRGNTEQQVIAYIREFRDEVKKLPSWEKGTPKRANNITKYSAKMESKTKVTVPGHVRASINWNRLCEMHGDKYAGRIVDGQKVIVCKLKENPLKYTSVAYPIDILHLPQWFKELPFDDSHMEEKLIDQKLDNIIGCLEWDIAASKISDAFLELFG